MLRCQPVTELISAREERQLRLGERVVLRMHLAMCAGCRNFDRQLPLLRVCVRQMAQPPPPVSSSADP